MRRKKVEMNNEEIILSRDEAPGKWVDVHDILANPTPAEVRLGNAMGQTINIDDDESGGEEGLSLRGLVSGGREEALRRARIVKTALLDHGVFQVSIELHDGRPTSDGSDTWNACKPVGPFSHHTVSRFSPSSLTPCLALVKSGRSDVPGPLCNGYGGYDLVYRIICCGMANHSGEGGAMSLSGPRGTFVIPQDSARAHMWGTEYEGGLSEADWDRELTNPGTGKKSTFREFMGRSNAALAEAVWEINGRGTREGLTAKDLADYHVEHKTWAPTRKIDRLNYSTASGRAELIRWAEAEENDMQLNDKYGPEDDQVVRRLYQRMDRYLDNVSARQKALLDAIRNDGLTDAEVQEIVSQIVAAMPDAQVDASVVRKAAHAGALAAVNRLRLTTEPLPE